MIIKTRLRHFDTSELRQVLCEQDQCKVTATAEL